MQTEHLDRLINEFKRREDEWTDEKRREEERKVCHGAEFSRLTPLPPPSTPQPRLRH